MTEEEFDADYLARLRRGIEGMEDRVRRIDTGRLGRIGALRHCLLPADIARPAENFAKWSGREYPAAGGDLGSQSLNRGLDVFAAPEENMR